jgi:D-serine deaminase-like pyridoxal phosphate-dependent protein
MQKDLGRIAELTVTRLEALYSLADEITAGQQACVALDLDALEAHDQQKQYLCTEVGRIDAELLTLAGVRSHEGFVTRLRAEGAASTQPELLRRIQRLAEQSEAARMEVSRRNQNYAEFLRRARATLNVMTNIVSHCLGVYPPWALPTSKGSLWEGSI